MKVFKISILKVKKVMNISKKLPTRSISSWAKGRAYINALARCSMSWFMLYFPCSSIKGIQHRKRRRERRPKSKLKLKLEQCVLTKEAFFSTYLAICQSVRPLLYSIPFHIYTNASYSIFNLLPF